MSDICGDNRFELIEKYKKELIEATNIETAPDEMAVLDDILFRFWQMGWLDKLELPSAPKWIPMSAREPEFGDYLTTYIEKETGKLGVTTDMYWSGGWDDDCDEFETLAWMPLPEPYKEEQDGNDTDTD